MPEDKENIYFDEDTLKKVYEGLLAAGVFGQQAVDAVNQIQNRGILFREKQPKRRGRPPKTGEKSKDEKESTVKHGELFPDGSHGKTGDAWKPTDGPDATAVAPS